MLFSWVLLLLLTFRNVDTTRLIRMKYRKTAQKNETAALAWFLETRNTNRIDNIDGATQCLYVMRDE